MNPYLKLKKILGGSSGTYIGQVVNQTTTEVFVRSSGGVTSLPVPVGMVLVKGDSVLVMGGAIRRKVKANEAIPVYTV